MFLKIFSARMYVLLASCLRCSPNYQIKCVRQMYAVSYIICVERIYSYIDYMAYGVHVYVQQFTSDACVLQAQTTYITQYTHAELWLHISTALCQYFFYASRCQVYTVWMITHKTHNFTIACRRSTYRMLGIVIELIYYLIRIVICYALATFIRCAQK